LNSAKVRLLDLPELLREFRGLERRRGASGRDRVDHGPRGHDDQCNSVAGALVIAQGQVAITDGMFVSGGGGREASARRDAHLAELGFDSAHSPDPWESPWGRDF